MSDRSKGKTANQPPVSAHPAFPVIVAVWFAALFGIGSMVLPLDMFERFSLSSGLADAYAAAQPPLGATARIAVAVIAALIGAAAGVFVAGRVRAAQAPRTGGRRAAALQPTQNRFSAKRPISAHEELGEGGLDAEEEASFVREAPARRRALAVTDDSAPSDFLSFAPLPGRSANDAEEPLDLVAFEEPAPREQPVEEANEPAEARFEPAPAEAGSSILSAPTARPFDYPSAEAAAEQDAPFAQPLPFLRSDEPAAEPIEAPEVEPAAVPVSERALGDLGMVELVERFAFALQRHQAAAAEVPEDKPAADEFRDETVAPAEVATVASAPEPPAEPQPQAEPAAVELPTALQPLGFDETEEDIAEELPDLDIAATLAQNRGPFSAPFASALDSGFDADDDAEGENDDVAEESYTSLLAMKSPLGHREPVRIDDVEDIEEEAEPVVVFPGQAARRSVPVAEAPARPFDAPLQRAEHPATAARYPSTDPHATERALREALEKLQRMSGAA